MFWKQNSTSFSLMKTNTHIKVLDRVFKFGRQPYVITIFLQKKKKWLIKYKIKIG